MFVQQPEFDWAGHYSISFLRAPPPQKKKKKWESNCIFLRVLDGSNHRWRSKSKLILMNGSALFLRGPATAAAARISCYLFRTTCSRFWHRAASNRRTGSAHTHKKIEMISGRNLTAWSIIRRPGLSQMNLRPKCEQLAVVLLPVADFSFIAPRRVERIGAF